MITVHVKLYGGLRDYVSAEKRGKVSLTLQPATTVKDLLASLGIEHPVLVAINSEHESEPTTPLQDGDHLAIFEFTAGG